MRNNHSNFHSNIHGRFAAFTAAIIILVSAGAASAGDVIFEAKLSEKDHFSSSGKRLTTVAAIIRQDRANFYKYGKRDAGDTRCETYKTAASRAQLEREIERMKISPALRKAILNGTPEIYLGADDDGTFSIGLKDW